MPKHQMLINVVAGEECRIAIIADGRLEELYQERASAESHVGNIYKGRVTNVEPSIQAAFIDFGQERNGFLHISDLHPMYFAGHDKDETEMVGQKTPRRDRPPIQKCLRRGQEILVQVLKEGIGTKGPTLTSYLSIPGRYLVMMPSMERLGVSRKVEDDDARREMRRILDELKPPSGFGFIIRTAGIGKNKTELKRDLAYLQRLWGSIEQRKKHVNVGELFAESDLVVRTIRDIFSTDIEQIIVDDELAAKRARDFLAIANPRTSSKVALYNDPIPLFHRFDIERQIETISSRTVPLPSGGSLVIDSTEALVAIDVNSGKMRDARDAEGTAFKANMEAADEICRQLRLRDLGGVIVSDLIDMRDLRHRRQIETRFRDNLKRDRARTRTSPISQFGILEMTRQRMRPSLRKSIYIDCPHCEGAAQVKSPESVVLDVTRRLALVMHRDNVSRVELTVGPAVAFALLNKKRAQLVALESRHDKSILVRVNDSGPADFVSLIAFDERDGQVEGESLTNMGSYELVPVEAVKGKVIVNREEAEPVEVEGNDRQHSRSFDHDDDQQDEPQTSSFESRDEDDESDSDDESQEQNQNQEEDDQGTKKRRRRRRRGGRGRSKRTDDQTDENSPQDEQSNTTDDDSDNQRDADNRNESSDRDESTRQISASNYDSGDIENTTDDTADDASASDGADVDQNDQEYEEQNDKPRVEGAQLAGLSKLPENQEKLKLFEEQRQRQLEKERQEIATRKRETDAQNASEPADTTQDQQAAEAEQDTTQDQDGAQSQNEEQDQDAALNQDTAPSQDVPQNQDAAQGEEDQEEGVKKRRRRRGGRRRSGKSASATDQAGSEGQDNQSETSNSHENAQPAVDDTATSQDVDGNSKTPKRTTRTRRTTAKSQTDAQDAQVVSRGYHNPVLKPSAADTDSPSKSADNA